VLLVLVQNRVVCGANPGQPGRCLSGHCTLRSSGCALRTRYAAPIGIVGTSGGLAGLVLPFSNVLCEEFRNTSGYLEVAVFQRNCLGRSRDSWSRLFPLCVVSLWWMSWSTPAGLNLSESRARGYVATWKLCLTPGHSKLEVNSNKIHQLCA